MACISRRRHWCRVVAPSPPLCLPLLPPAPCPSLWPPGKVSADEPKPSQGQLHIPKDALSRSKRMEVAWHRKLERGWIVRRWCAWCVPLPPVVLLRLPASCVLRSFPPFLWVLLHHLQSSPFAIFLFSCIAFPPCALLPPRASALRTLHLRPVQPVVPVPTVFVRPSCCFLP